MQHNKSKASTERTFCCWISNSQYLWGFAWQPCLSKGWNCALDW